MAGTKKIFGREIPDEVGKGLTLQEWMEYEERWRHQRAQNILGLVSIIGAVLLIIMVFWIGVKSVEDASSIVNPTFAVMGAFVATLPQIGKFFFNTGEPTKAESPTNTN